MNLSDLKEVQKIETELLKEVSEICKKHNIQYFLLYGTLLGAVRHGGPIPWDDDIDIGMTRENYKKFISIAKEELSEKNELRVMGSGSIKYVSITKIGRKNTVYCLPGSENLNIMNEVQLDVFVVDSLKHLTKWKKKLKETLTLIKLNWDEKKLLFLLLKRSKKKPKFLYKLLIYLAHGVRFLIKEKNIEHLIYNIAVDKTGNSEFVGSALGYCYWKKEDFSKSVLLDYNGDKYMCPINYDSVLTSTYGDYMKEPPEDKRYRKYFDEWIFMYR